MKAYFFKYIVLVIVTCLFLVPSYAYSYSNHTNIEVRKFQNFPSISKSSFSSSKRVRVIVKCKLPSVVEKNSHQPQFHMQSHNIIEQETLYKNVLVQKQTHILQSLPRTDSIQILGQWQIVYNGIAMSLPEYTLPFLAKHPEVASIYLDNTLFYPVRDMTVETIHRNEVPALEKYQNTIIEPNPDIRIGIVDSGIDYNHPDFYPSGFSEAQSKVAGGWDCYYPEEDLEKEKPGDPDPIDDSTFTGGHGTHVAGIAAGNNSQSTSLHGICPDATLFAYKVFPSHKNSGAPSYTLITACEYAVQDQCSVINLSLGHGGENPSIVEDNPYFEAFRMTKESGVMIVAAAGNGGSRTQYNQWPIDAPGVFDSILQVAASDDRLSQPFTFHTPVSEKMFLGQNSRFSPPFNAELDGLDIVYCGFGSKDECSKTDLQGKIAFIQRGPKENGISFFEKNYNAKEAGATACIIFNYDERSFSPSLVSEGIEDPYSYNFIPCMMVSATMQKQLQEVVDGFGYLSFQSIQPLIASYSSAGPCYSANDGFFKPEITAPGTSLYSAIPTFDPVESSPQWGKKQGTSMATPVITGCAAILRHTYPFLHIDEISALMMNTATILKNPLTGDAFSYFYQGSGQIHLKNAMMSPLVATPSSIVLQTTDFDSPIEIQLRNITNQVVSGTVSTEIVSHHDYADAYIGVFDKPFVTIDPHSTETVKCWLYPQKADIPDIIEGAIWIQVLPDEKKPEQDVKLHIPFVVSKKSMTSIHLPISEASLSVDTFHMNKDNYGFLSFRLNTGTISRSTYMTEEGSILRSIDKVRNYADQVFLTIHDEYGNAIESIFFGDSIPVGRYDFFWSGYDSYKQPFLPDGRYYFTVSIPGYEEIYLTTVHEDQKETHRKIRVDNHAFESNPIPFEIKHSKLPPFPIVEICTPQRVQSEDHFEVEVKLHNAYQGLFDVTIELDPAFQILYISENSTGSLEIQKNTNRIRWIHKQTEEFVPTISYIQCILRCSPPSEKEYVPTFQLSGLVPYFTPMDIPKTLIHPTIVSKERILLGDFNANENIDDEDLELLQRNFGRTSKDSTWNPIFDCFQDGVINIKDLFLIAKQKDL
ncbi:MAG: S8 family serine peptidase [Caldisericia bacterium]|nr:S8 family serine peptidase [Caldisericia bacterium]